MGKTLVIAECGSSHDNDLAKAYRLIEAAKECGADVAKFQWTSNAEAMAQRRKSVGATEMYRKYLEKPLEWLQQLKLKCDEVGIEFMCTVYLMEDIEVIAPIVKRFKVSAFENDWVDFVNAHPSDREIIISRNKEGQVHWLGWPKRVLYCVSQYPTPVEELELERMRMTGADGLSDHTTSMLTGALAVAMGAGCVEKHIRLWDTDPKNPDYGHSLKADAGDGRNFAEYVRNIRESERCL